MKVLVVRAGALGDLLLLRGALASLRAAGADVALLAPTSPGSSVVDADSDALAQRLLPWESASLARALGDVTDEPLRALLGAFDLALVYSRDAALAARLSAVAARVVSHDPAPPADAHASVALLQPLLPLGIPHALPPLVRPTVAEAREAAIVHGTLPRGFLAIHPGSGSAAKNWPTERYAALVRRLSAGQPWLLSLGPADEVAEPLAHEPGAVVTRELPPRALGAILAGAGVYVGGDSGVSHLAAAWGAPSVVLFGPTDPGTWLPVGPNVASVQSGDGRMESITVEDVVDLVHDPDRGREA